MWPSASAVLRPVPALPPAPQGLSETDSALAGQAKQPLATPPNKPETDAPRKTSDPSGASKKLGRKVDESAATADGGGAGVSRQTESVPISASVQQSLALPAEMSLKMDLVLKESPGASASVAQALPATQVPPSVAAAPSAVPAAGSIARPVSAMEALAHAQRLWNSGARLPAIDLLTEALALLERTPAALAGSNGGSVAPLAAVARELARMELAEGRVTQALEMLTRLQPSLANVPDIWAMRGNAAQRLGRHEESVAAYRAALKLRPDEPRWLLGAAVSLAAQGQTSAAGELVEKARPGGALSRDMAAYFQQLGVTISER